MRTSTKVKFALCTDLHFGRDAYFAGKLRKLSAHAPELLRQFVRQSTDVWRPDFIVNLGDDIEDESLELDLQRYREVLAIFGESKIPVHHVAGNHDTVHIPEADLSVLWGRPGPLYYVFERAGVVFIVLHTREVKDTHVTLCDEQLAWLKATLAATRNEVIVFMHHSAAEQHLAGNRWFAGHANICLVQQRKELRALLEAHGRVLCVLNGHLHWNHVDFLGGIPYVTLQSMVENLDEDAPGRPAAAYALVELLPNHGVIEIGGQEPIRVQFERK